ncbi:MAG: Fic family protein [Alphaproteobacteria bacterium]|nr:Fic family protein [Alphaproteobacteria bacterium]
MTAKIEIPAPEWNSELARTILDLEKLRQQQLYSEVPPHIFFQLKDIFQILETLGSARIEGNNTTLSEYVEKIIDKNATIDEKRQELENIEESIHFIERHTDSTTRIDRAYLSELHKIVTRKLAPSPKGEGSRHSGILRPHNVEIKQSEHTPPSVETLPEYYENFISFINTELQEQNQLLMVAIAHHRFMYIHPFDNGNGRTGRLLNYALLIKLGFNVNTGRLFNPSSVFYTDRHKYYEMLSQADSLENSDLLAWSEYFLNGLKNQIEKINHLMNREYTRDIILLPALKYALERQHITSQEFDILSLLVKSKEMTVRSMDLGQFGIKTSAQKSYVMKKLRDKRMVESTTKGGRTYTIKFVNNYLLRSVIKTLENNGFVAEFLNHNG